MRKSPIGRYLPPSNLLTWKVQSMGTTRKQVNIVDNKYVILTEISIHHKGHDCTSGDRKFVKEIRKDYLGIQLLNFSVTFAASNKT